MDVFIDYYTILEIPHTATKTEVKSAYKKQAKRWHPDKNPGYDTTQKMQKLNEAFLILNDDKTRNRYDREYLRFKSIQQEKERARKAEENKKKQQEQEKRTEEKNRQQKFENPFSGDSELGPFFQKLWDDCRRDPESYKWFFLKFWNDPMVDPKLQPFFQKLWDEIFKEHEERNHYRRYYDIGFETYWTYKKKYESDE
jgi:curved DNA-binding protein CbpA